MHCAGIAATIPLKMMTYKTYEQMFATNVIAALEFVKVITLKKNVIPGAAILLISSVAARKGEPGLLAYASSKGAIQSATKTLAAELAPRKYRVNCLCLGQLGDTDMGREIMRVLPVESQKRIEGQYPFGLGSVSGITGPTIFLLSDAACWITGSTVLVDGGYCL